MFPKYIDDMEALRIGIQFETEAYHEFRLAIKKQKNEKIKILLAILANNVLKNRRRLEKKYLRLTGKKILYLKLNYKQHLRTPFHHLQSDLQVLKIIIQQKEKKLDFLEKTAAETKVVCGRKILNELVSEEQDQLDLLKLEYRVREKQNAREDEKQLVNSNCQEV